MILALILTVLVYLLVRVLKILTWMREDLQAIGCLLAELLEQPVSSEDEDGILD